MEHPKTGEVGRSGRVRSGLRAIQRPWVTGLSLLALATCAASVDRGPDTGSAVGWFLRNPLGVPYGPAGPYWRVVVREELNLYQPKAGQWSFTSPFADPNFEGTPGPTLFMSYERHARDFGLWGVTSRTDSHRITGSIMSSGGPSPPSHAEIIVGRKLLGQYVRDQGRLSDTQSERLIKGDFADSTVLWVGILHNIATVASFVLLIVSLGWVGEWRRRGQRRRLLEAGECPKCRYSLSGLTVSVCPECGETLS